MTDEHHDNRYEDGEPLPRTDWSRPSEALLDWADDARKERRLRGERNPLIQHDPVPNEVRCDHKFGTAPHRYRCIRLRGHQGGCHYNTAHPAN